MKKLLLLFILSPMLLFSQVQIGQDIDGEAIGDHSGTSVSLSSNGDIVAIGAYANSDNGQSSGHVRIYRNQSGVWTQIGSDIDGEAVVNQSGASVSLSSNGNVVAIGAPFNNGNGTASGHVRIYRNQSGVWTQIGSDIDGEAANDLSGGSVSLSFDGSIVAIGAWSNDGNGSSSGHVRIYKNQSGIWTQIGSDIDGEAESNTSGRSISLSEDGSVVAIGATLNSDNGYWSGHVRIYKNQSGVWTQIGSDIDGEAEGDQFGRSVSISSDGSVVAIGAFSDDILDSGYVRIFRNQGDVWTQVGSDIDGKVVGWFKRISVSLSSDGSVVSIGSSTTTSNSSHVRIYRNQSEVWTQVGLDINGEESGDRTGSSVSLSSDGSLVAIGADENDGNGDKAGHVRIYDLNSVLSSDDFVLSRFSIYPNPTKKRAIIELKQGLELQNINIYNNLGQIISTSKNLIVDTSHLITGFYFLEIETNKGKASKKIIVE